MTDQGLDGPAQHRLAAQHPKLLGSAAAETFALTRCNDECRDCHAGGALGLLALSAKGFLTICRLPMEMLKPISIGPVRIEAPVILAPMTAVTDLPFRRIVKRY